MTILRLVNDLGQSIDYSIDPDELEAADVEDLAQEIYFFIWQFWGQQAWTTCVVWWEDQVVTAFVNWDKDFWEEDE